MSNDTKELRGPSKAAFTFIFITVVLDMLALGVVVPVLPKLIIEFEGGSTADAAKVLGVFGTAWALMQFVFSPVIGALSDRFGRRPIVLFSNLGLGLDYLLMAMAPSLLWLFVGRLVSGIAAATFSTASAYIADVSPPEKRAKQFGMLGAAFGLGFVVGPAVGGVLGDINLRLPFWVAGSLSLLNAAYGYFVLPESLAPENRSPLTFAKANPLGSMRLLASTPMLLGISFAGFVMGIVHCAYPSIFVLYTYDRFHWDSRTVGLVLAGVGVSSAIVSVALIGPIVKALGNRPAMLLGLMFGIFEFIAYGLANSTAMFLIGVPLGALLGIASPAMQSISTESISASDQGKLQGAFSSLNGIAGMIGPTLFTQVLAFSIGSGAGLNMPGAPFFVGAALLTLGTIVAAVTTRNMKSAATQSANPA